MFFKRDIFTRLVLWFALLGISTAPVQATNLADGDRVIFFGDSITELGMQKNGYVSLVDTAIQQAYPQKNIKIIGSGISGNTVVDLEKRLQRDVLDKQPNLVVIYVGVNDIWLAGNTVSKPQFSQTLSAIVSKIKQAGAKVILVTPAVMGERRQGENRFDQALDEYAAVTHSIAKRANCIVINLRGVFLSHLAKNNISNKSMGILTKDAVHLNDEGNRLLASELIKVLNISGTQVD